MTRLSGSCHCGNLVLKLRLSKAPESYAPRTCDCAFCQKHAAAYISDPAGSLRITVAEPKFLSRYRQGSDTAECLLCARCGVLVGVVFVDGSTTYATVNFGALDGELQFAEPVPVSPKQLAPEEKEERWRRLWFADVEITVARR